MAVAWAWVSVDGQVLDVAVTQAELSDAAALVPGSRVIPLAHATRRVMYADDLFQVLKDLIGLAKLAAAPLNTYHAAIRNGDELIKEVEREQDGH